MAVRGVQCIRAFFGNTPPVTDQEIDQQTHPEEDELLAEQGHQGGAIGEDEGERDASRPDDS